MRRVIRSMPPDRVEETVQEALDEQDAIEEIRLRRFHMAMALKDRIGLTDDERHELAQLLPGVDKEDGGSWKDLNPRQLHDLICYLEGWAYIQFLISQRLDSTN